MKNTKILFAVSLLAASAALAQVAPRIFADSPSDSATTKSACNISKNPHQLPCELMDLWNSMTLKQKAAQMVMVYMTPADFMIEHEFGGYLVMRPHLKKLSQFKENIQTVNRTLKIPPFVAMDQEGGRVNRASSLNPRWEKTPSAKEMRKMSNDSIFTLAAAIGSDMHKMGINMNLAPVLDPSKDSRGKNSFMEETDRSWGADSTAATKVKHFVYGMKNSGVYCVSKHFPGYDSWTNSDHQIAFSTTPAENVQNNTAFFRILSYDIPFTMMSSVRFIRVSSRPAVFEPKIVAMARKMSPETIIMTDDLWGVSLRAWISGTERVKGKNYPAKDFKKLVKTALAAGNDMFMITFPRKGVEMIDHLVQLGKTNNKYRQRIEDSCARILKTKYRMGLFKQGHY